MKKTREKKIREKKNSWKKIRKNKIRHKNSSQKFVSKIVKKFANTKYLRVTPSYTQK